MFWTPSQQRLESEHRSALLMFGREEREKGVKVQPNRLACNLFGLETVSTLE